MNIGTAVNTLATVTDVLANLAASAAQVSAIIKTAQADGRTELTPQEWAIVQGADTAARGVLASAIEAKS